MSELPGGFSEYLAARDRERAETAERMIAALTDRERSLVREAAVMGFVQGAMAAGGIERAEFPKDGRILRTVMDAVRSMQDLYPTLAALEDS